MNALLYKEIRLSLHPSAPLFLLLSAMLLIPNYPYYVVFFYTGLAVFFMCLKGRENNDVAFSLLLPVSRANIVGARFKTVIMLELLQLALAVPFALIRSRMQMPPNAVGMDAGVALFGFAFVLLGLFNITFFGIYYKNVQKVGKAFVVSSCVTFLYMAIAETMCHVVPFMRDVLDSSDCSHLGAKLGALAAGAVIYCVLTAVAYAEAKRNFAAQDL